MIKVCIVDDNNYLLKAIKEKLSFFEDIHITFTANDGAELLSKLNDDKIIDLILMDIEMPTINGIEATEMVKKKYPQIKIIMLTVFDNDDNILRSIKAGADGYLLKEVNPKDLYDGIQDTLDGGAAMTPSIAYKTLKLLRNPSTILDEKEKESIKLSSREVDVLEQLSKGLNYKNIADNLCVSPYTIRKHIENIYSKLQVHNKIEAIQKAKDNKLI